MAETDVVAQASFLAQTRLLGSLPFHELLILAASTGIYRCPAGQVIFRKDDPGDTLYLLQSGAVRIVLPLERGRETTLAMMYPGDLFGELSVLDGNPRSATAVAVEPVEAITLKRDQFLSFLRKQPNAAVRILGVLAARLRHTDELLGESVFLDIPARLAKKLLELAESTGQRTDQGIALPLAFTRQDLARWVGASSSTVSRYLRSLQTQGVLQVGRSTMLILQPEALQRLVR